MPVAGAESRSTVRGAVGSQTKRARHASHARVAPIDSHATPHGNPHPPRSRTAFPPAPPGGHSGGGARRRGGCGDRKSTRLNSSHLGISYAVFCLKKKKDTLTSLTRYHPRL